MKNLNYISSSEAAERWNITPRWVSQLAKQGRIPGAKQVGSRYMIPKDAPRPVDGRTKISRAAKAAQDLFRYPIFEYRDVASFDPPLDSDEQCIKAVEEAFQACRFKEAENILGDLPEKAKDRYHRIIALYDGCMIDLFTCNVRRYFDRYGKLLVELQDDFPHHNELKELPNELNAILGIGNYFLDSFHIDSAYQYHESFHPHLATLSAISITSPHIIPRATSINSAELSIVYLENSEAYVDLQTLHIYLGSAYATIGQKEAAMYHIGKAAEMAEKYDLYFTLAVHYYYFHSSFPKGALNLTCDFEKKLKKYSKDIHAAYLRFTEQTNISSIYTLLESKDFMYLEYAVLGLTNKEVANLMRVSTGTVGKKYGDIYAVLGVNSKNELIEFYRKTMGNTI